MKTIRFQIIEHLVSGQIFILSLPQKVSSPPVSDSTIESQKMDRFDMTSSERIKLFAAELRNLKAKFAAQEVELNELKVNATKQIDTNISIIRSQIQSEITKLKSKLSEANCRLEVMSPLNENVEVAI